MIKNSLFGKKFTGIKFIIVSVSPSNCYGTFQSSHYLPVRFLYLPSHLSVKTAKISSKKANKKHHEKAKKMKSKERKKN